MIPDEIIADTRIPDTNIFVLGSYEKRVTVYAQQVRALNLVDALLSENLVRPKARVAVIGGGAAGITAAAAMARASLELEQLDLFEARSNVLELQRGSTRYLHPHLYDWPAVLSDQADAGLPLMNWRAGLAGEVAETLRGEFDAVRRSTLLNPIVGQAVSELLPNGLGQTRVVAGPNAIKRIYDIVILAIGFGLERYLDGETSSYWTPSGLAGPIHSQTPNPLLFVSGNGDGGLVDFMMAAFDAFDHRAICHMLLALDLDSARAQLEAIEAEAWQDGADVDLLAAYRARVGPLIPAAAWAEITDRLRPNAKIIFHSDEPRLLRRTTALHNRLAVFLILEADRQQVSSAITVHVGKKFVGGVPLHGEVEIDGVAPFTPHRRYLRLGADSDTNLVPFAALLDTYPGAANPRASAIQPTSPSLTASAKARFASFAIPPGPNEEPDAAKLEAATVPIGSVAIRISPLANGMISWSGDVAPAAVGTVWANDQRLIVQCEVAAIAAAPLMSAIARLGTHAAAFRVAANDAGAWHSGIAGLCAARTLPGPNLQITCLAEQLDYAPAAGSLVEADAGELAGIVHDALDEQLLASLHAALFDVLGPAAVPMGWPIEPALRARLWTAWQQWHGALISDPTTRRRFLRLLASEKDQVTPDEGLLVRLGPKIIRPYLSDPVIFALAFAACSGQGLVPASTHPGNIASDVITGHSCGISWIDQRVLGARSLTHHVWTTSVVLLSQLRDAFRMIEGDARLDEYFSAAARIGEIAANEKPLVIGADEDFIAALEAGEAEVRDYFEAIFRWRAHAAGKALEGVGNGIA